MKWMRIAGMLVMVAAAALQFGCAVGSTQARSVDIKNSPLVNPAILVEGKDDQALYRYVKPGVDIKQYAKIHDRPGPGHEGWGTGQGRTGGLSDAGQ